MDNKINKPVFLGFTSTGLLQIAVIGGAVLFIFFLFMNTGSEQEVSTYSGNTATEDFSKCLTEKGAVLYGASWCPHCNHQKSMFGDYVDEIVFVDCEESKGICEAKEIEAYPTWIINGNKYLGLKSLKTLGDLTGCDME